MEVKPSDNLDGNKGHASNAIDDNYKAPTEREAERSGAVSINALRRSERVQRAPGPWWKAFLIIDTDSLALLTRDKDLSYNEAIGGPDKTFWKTAIESELFLLSKSRTWSLVLRQKVQKILTSKSVFKVKDVIHPDKSVTEKTKARLVVRGFQQVRGVEFNKTYASVVRFTLVPAVLALSPSLDLELHQTDVMTAFLNGDLDGEIFMEVPQGVKCDRFEVKDLG